MNMIKLFPAACAVLIAASSYGADGKQAAPAGPADAKAGVEAAEPSLQLNVPLFSPQFADMPVALVGDEAITVRELGTALAGAHQELDKERKAGKKRYHDMLNRLIGLRLVLQESKAMGLDELADVKEQVDAFQKKTLREMVMQRGVSEVKADKAESDKFYQEGIKEFKIRSVFFTKPADAEKAQAELKKSKDFDGTVKKMVESHEALAADEAKYVKRDDLQLEIAQAVTEMTAGSISPVITISSGYVVLRLDDVRTPADEDRAVREKAGKLSLKLQRSKGLEQMRQDLLRKYVKVDRKLFDKLNYEGSKSEIEALMKDTRTIAEIRDEQPITVADFTKAFRAKFFHGIESAAETKEVNEKKTLVLDELLNKRIFVKEALLQGLDKTDEYKAAVREYENGALFDQFIRKAVVPGIKPTEEQLKAYYEAHGKDYSSPKMVRLSSVTFVTQEQAQKAINKIKKGTSFKWTAEHADGLAPDAGDFAPPEGTLLLMKTLPDGLRKALEGAKQGDVKLYAGGKDRYHVVQVTAIVPEKVQPFEEKRKDIWEKVVAEQIDQSLETWIAKLRVAYPVTVYIAGDNK